MPHEMENSTGSSNDSAKENFQLSKMETFQRTAFLRKHGMPTSNCFLDGLLPENNTLRSIPNDFARSSLFTARSPKDDRVVMMNKELYSYSNTVVIMFSGIELRTYDDEIVWMQIINYAKSVQLGEAFELSLTELLESVGWPRNGTYYQKARDCITRLRANEILVRNKTAFGTSGSMSLIHDYSTVNDKHGMPITYRITIHPNLIYLFAGHTFTNHLWAIYRKLSPVARRLADYVNSHKEPHPLALDVFRQICASNNKNARSWRSVVAKACKDIKEAKIVENAEIVKEKIFFTRTPKNNHIK